MPMTHARLVEVFGEPATIESERIPGLWIVERAEFECGCGAHRILLADHVGGWGIEFNPDCKPHVDRMEAGEIEDAIAEDIDDLAEATEPQ